MTTYKPYRAGYKELLTETHPIVPKSLMREQFLRTLMKVTQESREIHPLLKVSAKALAQFLGADRCLVVPVPMTHKGKPLILEQFCFSDVAVPVLKKDFPVQALRQLLETPIETDSMTRMWKVTQKKFPQDLKIHARQYGINTFIAINIRQEDTVWGYFIFHFCHEEPGFDTEDLQFLSETAEYISFQCQQIDKLLQEETLKAEIQKAEERYRLVLESYQDGYWDWDLTTGVIYCNESFYHLVGRERPSEHIASLEKFAEILHPDDKEEILASVNAHLSGGPPYEIDYRMLHGSGEYRYYNSKGKATFDSTGKPVRLSGLITDITKRKQTEFAILQNRQHLETVAEWVPAMIWVTDENGLATYMNKRFLEFYGATQEEVLDYGWIQQIHEDDAQSLFDAYMEAFHAKRNFSLEYRVKRFDGIYRQVLAVGVPIVAPDKTFSGFIGTIQDVTDQKNAELSLKESQRRLLTLAESVPIMLWMDDPNGLNTYVNKRWLEFTGRSEEEEEGFGWLQSLHPEDSQKAFDTYMDAFNAGRPFETTYRLKRYDGLYRIILSRGIPVLSDDQKFSGYVGVCEDVTDQKQTEEALRKSEEVFHTLVDNAPILVWMNNTQGELTFMNKKARQFCGKTLENNQYTAWVEQFIHPDDAKTMLKKHMESFNAQKEASQRYRLRNSKGEYRWVMTFSAPRFDWNGTFAGYITTAYDITEQNPVGKSKNTQVTWP